MLLGSDPAEAMRLVLRAAELGSAEAQWRVGQVLSGRIPIPGMDANREESLRWYREAAEQGYSRAHEALADLYSEPDAGELYEEAAAHYRSAAESGGSAWAILRLVMISATGEGVAQDDDAARRWLSILGANGDLDPARFSSEDLDVLEGLQAYYGLDLTRGGEQIEPNLGVAVDSFRRALLAPPENLIHPSFRRTAGVMLRRSGN
jgi:TPR repeat protein